MRLRRSAAWTLALLLALSGVANAEEQADGRQLTQPISSDEPLQVKVGMILMDLHDIDDAEQSFNAVLIVRLEWLDARLQGPGAGRRTFSIGEVWSPRFQITNEIFARKRFREVLNVGPDGTVVYLQRLSGRFSSRLDLRGFPFDRQMLTFRLSFPDFEPNDLDVVPDPAFSGTLDEITIADWEVTDWKIQSDPLQALEDISRASVTLDLETKRRTGYYVWKLIFPLMLIVAMSWSIFWIDPENVGAGIGVATSSMLTLIAYRFISGNLLPRISYLTELDYFILGSTSLVFLALIEVVTASSLARAGRGASARRLDGAARLAFPLAYGLLVIVVFVL